MIPYDAGKDKYREGEIAAFGPFRLVAAERLLQKNDVSVDLGSRALDILIALVERAGEVVSRRELNRCVWPDLVVEEANLRVQIARLRKVLGDGEGSARYVANIPGRGYCFVAPVQRTGKAGFLRGPAELPAAPAISPKLPARLARMIGREETVTALAALLASHRFVSVIGPGGMGKTTVAVSVAHALLDDFDNAVFFVDLGALSDATLVPATIASAVGFLPQAQDPVPGLLAFVAGRRMLLVLDNCEHMIEAVASLSERLYSETSQLHLLTTSREALRVEGEHVHLLLPLDNPPEGAEFSAAQALESPAVQLFMERARAAGHRFELSDADAPVVARICRRLDGIALAIELAASRVGAYGIQGTAELLCNRFKLLWQGRRSSPPRHQTLRAMLDWSFNLLPERDRRILARLSIFVGVFTLESAQSVAADSNAEALDVADALASLVDKSLISTSSFDGTVYYRLLDTTRDYAATKRAELSEEHTLARSHARHYCVHLEAAAIDRLPFEGRDLAFYTRHIGNVRAALEWSFSDEGNDATAVELAVCSAPLFLGLSLLGECQRWCARGLAALAEAHRGSRRELALQKALAISVMFTQGNRASVRDAIERGLYLAEALGERQDQLDLLAGLHIYLMRGGDIRAGVAVAERSAVLAEEIGAPGGIVMADWMLGCAYHLAGDQEGAQRYCELGLKRAAVSGLLHFDFFVYDHRARALAVLARALWLRGFPERAARVARQAVEEAERRGHPVNLCISLINTATVFLWIGDLARAEKRIAQLVAHAARHSLAPYHAVGQAFAGELALARGQAAGVEQLRDALAALHAEQHNILATGFFRALAEGLAQRGEFEEAAATIDAALARAERQGGTFDMPDLLRARGEILLASPEPSLDLVEAVLLDALACARRHSALGWALRAAIALAKLRIRQGRKDEARELLTEFYGQFTEGLETADLQAARRLLEKLGEVASNPQRSEAAI